MISNEKLWRLMGSDTFSGDDYRISVHATQPEAEAAAKQYLDELDIVQPPKTSGGQTGIQDRIYIVRPNGTRYRYTRPKP